MGGTSPRMTVERPERDAVKPMARLSSTDNPHTTAIASFVSGFRYERIPADVLARGPIVDAVRLHHREDVLPAAGDHVEAKTYFQALAGLAGNADTPLPELTEATTYLTR